MSKFIVLCLILSVVLAVLATGAKTDHKMTSFEFTNAPRLSPSYNGKSNLAKAPAIRKLGKHKKEEMEPVAVAAAGQSLIPSQGPAEANSLGQENRMSEIHLEKRHHHNVDKSIAGGGVIIGGLATMFFLAVFCYIRVTRRKSAEPSV